MYTQNPNVIQMCLREKISLLSPLLNPIVLQHFHMFTSDAFNVLVSLYNE